jgi:hypothetical protein
MFTSCSFESWDCACGLGALQAEQFRLGWQFCSFSSVLISSLCRVHEEFGGMWAGSVTLMPTLRVCYSLFEWFYSLFND